MATPEERLSTLDARFASLMEILENQLTNMNERLAEVCRRLDGIRIWLIALTGLAGIQLAALIALSIVMS